MTVAVISSELVFFQRRVFHEILSVAVSGLSEPVNCGSAHHGSATSRRLPRTAPYFQTLLWLTRAHIHLEKAHFLV